MSIEVIVQSKTGLLYPVELQELLIEFYHQKGLKYRYWKGTEVVITAPSRKRMVPAMGTWVRIPPLPPFDALRLLMAGQQGECPEPVEGQPNE